MTRRKFSREFKVEAIKLVADRGVAVAQAARDLDVESWRHSFEQTVRFRSVDRLRVQAAFGQGSGWLK